MKENNKSKYAGGLTYYFFDNALSDKEVASRKIWVCICFEISNLTCETASFFVYKFII